MDYMPFIRGLTENTVKGRLMVSVKGGNTANSEYEFLTGNSMAFLPVGLRSLSAVYPRRDADRGQSAEKPGLRDIFHTSLSGQRLEPGKGV